MGGSARYYIDVKIGLYRNGMGRFFMDFFGGCEVLEMRPFFDE